MKYQIMPPLTIAEFEALRKSIESEGIRESIIVDENDEILDGHHRYQIRPDAKRRKIKGLTENEKLAFVIQANMGRRNLSPAQKKEIREKIKKIAGDLRKENPKKNTQERVSELLGVAQNTVSTWFSVDRTNIKVDNSSIPDARVKIPPKQKPIILERAEKGETQEQIAADYGVTQRQISTIITVQKKEKEKAEVRKNTVIETDCQIHIGDFREIGSQVLDDSVDLIFTDPPYDENSITLYEDMAKFAARVLRPGGWCLAYSGHTWLPDVLAAMAKYLTYGWTFAIQHSGGDFRYRKLKLQSKWKPVIGFYKPPLSVWWDWFPDMTTGGKEKEDHEWQQALGEAEHFIGALSPIGGLVCDPFCGSGTTCLAAKNQGRQWIAFEQNEETGEKARMKVSDQKI